LRRTEIVIEANQKEEGLPRPVTGWAKARTRTTKKERMAPKHKRNEPP